MGAPEKSSWRRWSTAANGSCRSRHSMSAPRFRCPQANFCAWRATSAANFSCDSPMRNPQLNGDGRLQHLLTIEGLPREILVHILDTAASFIGVTEREVKKVPLLRGKSVFNLFFEPSTRTRTTFEIAAKRLSADVINLNIAVSSSTKGETLLDTVDNLSAMHADMFVVRHSSSGAAHLIANHVASHVHVINAGDGLTPQKLALAKPDAIVMHPGPMNRGVEIDSSVADGPHSVILPQVTFGIAVRMAVMSILAGN